MSDKYDISTFGEHSITSENVLLCAETGRVVAVFYNAQDAENAISNKFTDDPLADLAAVLRHHKLTINASNFEYIGITNENNDLIFEKESHATAGDIKPKGDSDE